MPNQQTADAVAYFSRIGQLMRPYNPTGADTAAQWAAWFHSFPFGEETTR